MTDFELPCWINKETWAEYEKMRNKKKCPMSDYARRLAVRTLRALVSVGEDPQEVLDQSIFMCWQGLFPVKKERQAPVNREALVGQGPRCGPARVRPEVLARIAKERPS